MSEPRRWTIYRGADAVVQDEGFEPVRWTSPSCVDPELGAGEEIEVMPVSEHEETVRLVASTLRPLAESEDLRGTILEVELKGLLHLLNTAASGQKDEIKRRCTFAMLTVLGWVVYRLPERWVRWLEDDR